MYKKIKGFVAASLTGFNQDGTVNLDIIPRYAAMLHSSGIAGVFVNGTTGEGYSLTLDERLALAKCWVDSAPEGLIVLIHVGYTDKDESRALAIHAAEIGADGIGQICPINLQPKSVKELVDYVSSTASSSPELPYYYYHMPSINNVSFPMIDFLILADETIPNLAGIKYTHDDILDYKLCREFMDGKYDILFGRDEFLMEGLKAGAQGAVGSTYNIMVSLYHELLKAFCNGDLETAQNLQNISAEACKLIYNTGSFGFGLKTIMRKIGLDFGGMRTLQVNLSENKVNKLDASLQKSGMYKFLNKV